MKLLVCATDEPDRAMNEILSKEHYRRTFFSVVTLVLIVALLFRLFCPSIFRTDTGSNRHNPIRIAIG